MLRQKYLLLSLVAFLLQAELLSAATVFVSTTGTDNLSCGALGSPCNTINYAVNNVASGGDSIYILSGTYAAAVVIPEGESFIFVGDTTGGAVIDGGSVDRGFLYDYVTCGKTNDGNAAILDFQFHFLTIRDCYYLGATCNSTTIANGAAIYLVNDNDGGTTMDVTIRNCVFEDNLIEDHGPNNNGRRSNGGAVALHGFRLGNSDVLIEDCQFRNNEARQDANGGHGGALWLAEFPDGGSIRNCYFENNSVYGVNTDCGDQGLTRNGGGALCILGTQAYSYNVDDCSFLDNSATICPTCCTTNASDGGAILVYGSGSQPTVNVSNSFFCNNTVDNNVVEHTSNYNGTLNLNSNVFDQFTNEILGSDTTACRLDSLMLERSLNSALNISFLWNDGSTDSVLWVDSSGAYTLELSYGSCTQKDTINVSFLNPQISASGDTILCDRSPVQLMASGANSYVWTPGSSLDDSAISSPIANPANTTSYIVRSNDDSACFDSDTLTITIADVNTTTSPGATICPGDEITLFATGGDSYVWEADSTLSALNISNPTARPLTSTTYSLSITDSFGCVHLHSITIGVYETDSLIITNDTTVEVPGVQLLIETTPHDSITWTPSQDLDCEHCPEPNASVYGDITYYASAVDTNGCLVTDSISIFLLEDSCNIGNVFIPNSFTPNGDGTNDVFELFGLEGDEDIRFSIFDRWGDEIFTSTSLDESWDGNIRGKNASPGVYVYYIHLTCTDGYQLEYKGNVTLLR